MRSLGPFLPLCLGLALWMAADGAHALPLCHEEVLVDEGPEGALAARDDRATEAILPCAMLENGGVGPWCVDASVYVVTPSGVLLCRVALTALELPVSELSLFEDAAAKAVSSTASSLDASALSSPLLPTLPVPLALELDKAVSDPSRPDRPSRPDPPFVPG